MSEKIINICPSIVSMETAFSLQIYLKVPTNAETARVDIIELGSSMVEKFNLTANNTRTFALNGEYSITYLGETADEINGVLSKKYGFKVIDLKDN
jgi:hypothetical protein